METAIKAEHEKAFVPAAGHDFFLPLYDPVTKLIGADRARTLLLEQAGLRPGQRVLDIGCGTGTLAVLLKQAYPQVEIVALDPDLKALERAKRKAHCAAVPVCFDRGFANSLRYGAGEFDAVFSSFMFHHLDIQTKQGMLAEVRRVLKPGGHLHLLDFGGESTTKSRLSRGLQSHFRLEENSETAILSLMAAAGLLKGAVAGRRTVLFGFGLAVYYRASAPTS